MALAVTPFSIKLPISYQVARVGTNTQSENFHNRQNRTKQDKSGQEPSPLVIEWVCYD